MKKLTTIVLSVLLLFLTACGNSSDTSISAESSASAASSGSISSVSSVSSSSESEETPDDAENGSDELDEAIEAIGGVDVNSGLFDVTVTIPADYAGESVTQESLDQTAQEKGYQSAVLNEDGSVTYVMTKEQHKELMDVAVESIEESLSEMANSEEYPNISSVEANDDYTDFTVTITSETLELAESFSVLAFAALSGMYHAFNGTQANDVHVSFVNAETGSIIDDWNASDMAS